MYVLYLFQVLSTVQRTVVHCLWEKQHHDAIHSSRNFKKACCIAWHSEASIWRLHCVWVSIWGQIHIHIDEDQTLNPNHGVWGGHLQWWYYASIHLPTWPYTEAHIKYLKEAVLPWIERVVDGNPMSGSTALCHATKAGESSLGYEKISETTLSLTSGCLMPQSTILLIIISEVQLNETPTKLHVKPKMNWRQE